MSPSSFLRPFHADGPCGTGHMGRVVVVEPDMVIYNESVEDGPLISRLITEAFKTVAYASGTEAEIVDRLRTAQALSLSLVAKDGTKVIGYLAASAARVGKQTGWSVIGPLAVEPSRQRQGIGIALMTEALARLRGSCRGAALAGDPAYYGRFGFRTFPGLVVTGCPPEAVLALPFDGTVPCGELIHHPAFGLHQPGA